MLGAEVLDHIVRDAAPLSLARIKPEIGNSVVDGSPFADAIPSQRNWEW